jgi:selenocysteine lyase/cysteine desulfurase
LEYLKKRGVQYTVVPSSKEGLLDVNTIESYLRPETRLLCFTHASNVLGTILPVKEIGELAHRNNLLFMVDSAQTAGVIPIDVDDMNIDFLAFTGHKGLLGPPGTGGYYLREGLDLNPLIYGGTGTNSAMQKQPGIWPEAMESGTRNVPGIAALGAGVDYILKEGINKIRQHELDLITLLMELIKKLAGVEILGVQSPKLRTGLVSCTFLDVSPDSICAQLDRNYGIITRSGLHCAPFAHSTAGTMQNGALRISPGPFNTEAELGTLYKALADILGGENKIG